MPGWRACVGSLLLAVVASGALAAPTPQQYIGGFVLYVRWPDDAQIAAWQVCAASANTAADTQYAELQVRDRSFAVRHIKAGETLDGCQILDLTGSDAPTAVALLKASSTRRGLLTVGNGRDFCSAGGMICLLPDEPRGGFEVNLSAIRGAGFSINAKLLMMARQPDAGGAP